MAGRQPCRALDRAFPFHPNTIAFQTQLGLACGGWPALPTNEDLAFVLALSEATDGLTVDHVVTRYRDRTAKQ